MGQIKVVQCHLEGLRLIQPTIHIDVRGNFCEVFSERDLREAGIERHFVQENQSVSRKGVLRGLHFQRNHPQAKLVRVASGRVFDVVVDIRPGSRSWGKWYGVELSSENFLQLYIPEGFAHGMLVLSDTAVFVYKCTEFYYPEEAQSIAWNDPDIGIEWPGVTKEVRSVSSEEGYLVDGVPLILSEKDRLARGIRQFQ